MTQYLWWDYKDGISSLSQNNVPVVDGNGNIIGEYKLNKSGDGAYIAFNEYAKVNENPKEYGYKVAVQIAAETITSKAGTAYPYHEIVFEFVKPTEETSVPSNPTDVKVEYADGVATVTWTAVTTDTKGNAIEGVVYNVVRSDNRTVATEISDNTCTDNVTDYGTYSYKVMAKYQDQVSDYVESNSFTIERELIVKDVPYSNALNSYDLFNECTAIDVNNDGGWFYHSDLYTTMILKTSGAPKDDWLITPALNMVTEKNYTVSVDTRKAITDDNEKFEVWLGTAATVDGMTTKVLEATEVSWTENTTTVTPKFTVPEAGLYYVGVRAVSDVKGTFYISNLKVDASESMVARVADKALEVVNGEIIFNGNEKVAVYSVDGKLVGTANGNCRMAVNNGIYIVRVGNATKKIVVK